MADAGSPIQELPLQSNYPIDDYWSFEKYQQYESKFKITTGPLYHTKDSYDIWTLEIFFCVPAIPRTDVNNHLNDYNDPVKILFNDDKNKELRLPSVILTFEDYIENKKQSTNKGFYFSNNNARNRFFNEEGNNSKKLSLKLMLHEDNLGIPAKFALLKLWEKIGSDPIKYRTTKHENIDLSEEKQKKIYFDCIQGLMKTLVEKTLDVYSEKILRPFEKAKIYSIEDVYKFNFKKNETKTKIFTRYIKK